MKIEIGSRVRLTGQYLHDQRRFNDPEGLQVWTVLGFEGRWAIVDEPIEGYGMRRICLEVLCGELEVTHKNCPITKQVPQGRRAGLFGTSWK